MKLSAGEILMALAVVAALTAVALYALRPVRTAEYHTLAESTPDPTGCWVRILEPENGIDLRFECVTVTPAPEGTTR